MGKLDELKIALVELDEERTLSLTRELLETEEATPSAILDSSQQALRVVGERYERQEYYLSALIMAGELFKEVIELTQPAGSKEPLGGPAAAGVLIGTVAGDIHDIGKNMFATALRGAGFSVVDLGVDVPPERFVTEVEKWKPAVVGLSGLIWTAVESMHRTVELLRANENRLGYRPPVILGGGVVDGKVCRYCGADSWSTDAMEGVRICERLIARG